MSTRSGKIGHHKFHGDPARFEAVAFFMVQNYTGRVKRIADVAGGLGKNIQGFEPVQPQGLVFTPKPVHG